MGKEYLFKEYLIVQNNITPIIDLLEREKDNDLYKGRYKGVITLQSPLVLYPEILFIGINPGDGAYKERNHSTLSNETPIRLVTNLNDCNNQLNWFDCGNARGYFKDTKKKKDWKSYDWFQRDKRVNNNFPKNMIDLLYEVAKIKYTNEEEVGNVSVPFWFNDFGQKIMFTNLYPIITTDINDLKNVHENLAKETELKACWESVRFKDENVNNWVVRKYFIKRVDELVKLVKPKIIVCIGKSAFNDFTFSTNNKEKVISKMRRIGENDYPVIGFSRTGSWSGLIPEIAKLIVEKQVQ